MSSVKSTPIDGPTCYAVTVVNLLQRDSRRHHNIFHSGSVPNRNVGIGIKWLDQDATTSVRQSGTHESSCILNIEQSCLNINTSG